ncbi:polysaccharide pyruvyl transferase family protein [Umezakia ovalisporum]|jgi:polysaccharide pyruvyl transferase WcaK-like protein|uniref:polysaccharide pyruvyl transferase family protein n=2 Tax=Umezakia ovalisporum TaxID=75695 RepID=UPI0006EFE536|nr:polysaccharide pyruvyl transferase family protein [Umezakia ovalisporum]MDH6086172.1 polysaccharide pyruvyl transferase family protein [Umezakia ovalisporum TAC611]CEJ44714.1 Polysaccharide pyruvyl transferase [Umezakia ovalisporum]
MKILMMGYYGCNNVGDDIFVNQLTKFWESQQLIEKVFVLCQDNYYHSTAKKIKFFSNKLTKLQRLWLMLNSDFIVWGGGTLNFSSKPKNLLRLQTFTKLMGKRFCFLGVGLESFKPGTEKNLAQIFENADFLYVRDKHSYSLVSEKINYAKSFHLGGDLAFLDLAIYEKYLNKKSTPNQLNNISFSGKFWWGEGRGEFYAQQLMPLIEKFNSVIHLLPAHQGKERNDNQFHQLLKKYLPEDNCQIHSWEQPEHFVEILSRMDFHFGNRLHSVIIADLVGVPNLGIGDYPSKISNYIEKTGILAQQRIAAFMEPISLDRIEHIYHQYQRPEEFILNESNRSRECLEKLLQCDK